mgnify:CR=1 FL=1
MTAILGEVKRMAEGLHIEHGQKAVSAAGLLLLTTRLLEQVEITTGEDMSALLQLQQACVWLRGCGRRVYLKKMLKTPWRA